MNRYLVITRQCSYFINASNIENAVLQVSIWNTVRVVKWMVS